MIRSIYIKNYKCFEDFAIEGLGSFNVLVGPNDSGKTAFLEAVRLVTSCRSWGPDGMGATGIEERLGLTPGLHWVWRNDRARQIQIEAVGPPKEPDWDPAVIVKSKEGNPTIFTSGARTHSGKRGPGAGEGLYVQVVELLGNAAYYRLDPVALRLPSPFSPLSAPMTAAGKGFPTFIANMKLNETSLFGELVKHFTGRFQHYRTIDITEGGGYVFRFNTVHGEKLPAEGVSDGVMVSLAFMALSHTAEPPKILLIEEPENHVHPGSLKEIVQTLRNLSESKGVQVFATTHSPYLLDMVEPAEVWAFAKDEDGSVQAKSLSEYPDLEQLSKHFMTGEIWSGVKEENFVFGKDKQG